MHIAKVAIKNFRSLKEFGMEFKSGANLIVGPNAVGKTTVLEAIRLAKAVLAPRTSQEGTQVLLGLGAVSQQLPQMFNFHAIAKDPRQPVEIDCGFTLTDSEVAQLPELFDELCRATVASPAGVLVWPKLKLANHTRNPPEKISTAGKFTKSEQRVSSFLGFAFLLLAKGASNGASSF